MIEHNLDVIKTSDWIIDMGPEGGSRGGMVVAEGTPEEVAAVPDSHTGTFLKPHPRGSRRAAARRAAPRSWPRSRPPASRTTKKAAGEEDGDRHAAKKAPVRKAAAKKSS